MQHFMQKIYANETDIRYMHIRQSFPLYPNVIVQNRRAFFIIIIIIFYMTK